MARQQRYANVKSPLVQIASEIVERLGCITEAMQEKNRPRVIGAQVDEACAWNFACYWSSIGIRACAGTCDRQYLRASRFL